MRPIQRGFTFVDVIFSMAILMIMALLLTQLSNSYHRNFKQIRVLNAMATVVSNEILLLEETGNYETRTYDRIKVRYEVEDTLSVGGVDIIRLVMHVEDLENGTKKEYVVLCQEA